MLNINYIKTRNDSLVLMKYEVTTRRYTDLSKETWDDFVGYFAEDELEGYEVRFIAKHQLFEIIDIKEIDTSGYEWITEIVPEDESFETISKIVSCNSKEEYEASLEQNKDLYLLDIEERISLLELGI